MRRRFRPCVIVAALVSLALLSAPAAQSRVDEPVDFSAHGQRGSDQTFVPHELIVRYRPRVSSSQRASLHSSMGSSRIRSLRLPRTELVRLKPGKSVSEARAEFERRPEVLYAEPNYLIKRRAIPSDPDFGQQWSLNNTGQTVTGPSGTVAGTPDADVDAPEAWDVTSGDSSIVVAVVDTGVEYAHPDLAANIWSNPGETANGADDDGNGLVDDVRGWDFFDDDSDPWDPVGHGTHVAGIVGAVGNNAAGIAGVTWNVRIIPVRALGPLGGTEADIVDALAYAALMGARIVNGSFGSEIMSQAEADVITLASDTLFVFAAANGGSDEIGDNSDAVPDYPCRLGADLDLANVICVAATDQSDGLAPFSNYGAATIDLGAPGTNIRSTFPVSTLIFSDDFESGLVNWTTGGVPNSWGTTSEAFASPSHSLTDSPGNLYANNADSFAQTRAPISLAGQRHCLLGFLTLIDTQQDADVFRVELATSSDGPWTTVAEGSGELLDLPPISLDISPFAGQPAVFIRFRLVTDSSMQDDGVYVDDVAVTCFATPTADTLGSLDGTSMATPHVSGVAALVLSQFPAASPAYVRAALLGGVDPVPALAGRTLTGGRLNAFRALDASPPTNALVDALPVFQSTRIFSPSWTAIDEKSGVASFDVRFRRARFNGAFGSFAAFRTRTPKRSETLAAATGHTYCLSVSAIDNAGNASGYSAERCTAVPVNNTQLAHSSGWSKRSGSGYFEGTFSQTTTRGATLSLGVTGKRIAVVVTQCRGCGTISVFLGSTLLRTIDLNTATTARRQIIPVKNFTSARSGTLRIRVVSPTGERVVVEGVGVSRV